MDVPCRADYRKQFRIFDRDLNGFISVRELTKVMEEQGQLIRKAELMRRLRVVDNDADKQISFTEFVNMAGPCGDTYHVNTLFTHIFVCLYVTPGSKKASRVLGQKFLE